MNPRPRPQPDGRGGGQSARLPSRVIAPIMIPLLDVPTMTFPAAGAAGQRGPEGRSAAAGSLRGRMVVAGLLASAGGLLMTVDLPVAVWFRTHDLPGDLARLVDFSEVFAHGLGAAAVLGVVVALDPSLRQVGARRDLARLCLAAFSGGLVVDLIKGIVTRVRPRAADLEALSSALATFGDQAAAAGFGPAAGPFGKTTELMSFPSGHAAVAAGMATALAWKYPHGLGVFVVLAACAGMQRVVSSAHYPSDVAFGAAVGVALAAACLGGSRPAVTASPTPPMA